ncbi:MAG: shikimate dehydrogenase family protein [Fusobacteriaceae bacterium]
MEKYVLVGENISYTLSPKLHKIFFQEMGIDGEYGIEDGSGKGKKESFLESIVSRIRRGDLKGANITVPYKEEILKYIDILDSEARKIGSVNTLVLENGKIKGYNTDYIGVLATLNKMKINIRDRKVYILGNGGSAKAVFHAVIIGGGIPYIISRNPNNENNQIPKIKNMMSYSDMEKMVLGEEKESILINTTPIGNMNHLNISPVSQNIAEKFQAILDLHYRPLKTKLMEYSSNSENGLYMLTVQGVESEKIWNKNLDFSNKKDIIEKIYENLKEELEKNE